MEEVNNDSVDPVESTEQIESTDAPENVTSSTETGTQGESAVQAVTQTPTDPLSVLESLQLDPKIKEDLKNGYLRQADYTRKTQELASVRKTVDEYTQVKPLIDYLNQNPQVFNEIFGKMQGQTQPQQGQDQLPDDPREYADYVKKETRKEFQAMQAQESDFREAAAIDPRLNSDPEFGEAIAKMVAQDPMYKSKQISARDATERAVKWFDTYIAKHVANVKSELTEKAKAKKLGNDPRTSSAKTNSGRIPMNIAEAARMAEEELAS